MTNGVEILEKIINENVGYSNCSWEDDNGAYHDSGWNESWPDGYHGDD